MDEPDAFEAMIKSFTKKNALKTRRKFKQHTSKIVSSFKPPLLTASLVKEYRVLYHDNLFLLACTVHY